MPGLSASLLEKPPSVISALFGERALEEIPKCTRCQKFKAMCICPPKIILLKKEEKSAPEEETEPPQKIILMPKIFEPQIVAKGDIAAPLNLNTHFTNGLSALTPLCSLATGPALAAPTLSFSAPAPAAAN